MEEIIPAHRNYHEVCIRHTSQQRNEGGEEEEEESLITLNSMGQCRTLQPKKEEETTFAPRGILNK